MDIDQAAVAPYLGRYTNDALGEITIELEDGKLIMDVGEFRSGIREKAGEDQEATDYILESSMALGFPLRFRNADQGEPIIVFGVGVIEYTFQKVE